VGCKCKETQEDNTKKWEEFYFCYKKKRRNLRKKKIDVGKKCSLEKKRSKREAKRTIF